MGRRRTKTTTIYWAAHFRTPRKNEQILICAAKETPTGNIISYICDFSRCRLNVRLTACIQPLLRGYKYRVSALFGSCLLAAHANSGFILRKIWGRLQTVVTFWGIEIMEDWHLSYHFKLFDIITIFGRFLDFIHSPYNFFAFFSIFITNEFVFSKNKFINTL